MNMVDMPAYNPDHQLGDDAFADELSGNNYADTYPGERLRRRPDAIRQLDETLLERLVALNAERAQEEKRGLIRYLRPEFQDPNFKASAPEQAEMAVTREENDARPAARIKVEKIAWPKRPDKVRRT